eukprot:c21315_g1_i1 orf=273-635(-)
MGAAVHNVFVYGTLLANEVVSALLQRIPPSSAAFLPDFHRYSIKGRVYPAILPANGDKVLGKVLFGLNDQELKLFDDFEDVEYRRQIVEPVLLEWRKVHLQDFTTMCSDFSAEIIERRIF